MMIYNSVIRNILIAIDGSDYSLAAVNLLCDLHFRSPSSKRSCHITALGVLLPRDISSHATYLIPLNQAQKILQDNGYKVSTELILGYPAEVITNFADTHSTDMIVVGAKGLRATLGILLGGVAQQIVEYSICPVLVVRSPYKGIHNVMLVTDGSESSKQATEFLAHLPLNKSIKIFIVHVLPPASLLETEYLMRTWAINEEVIQNHPLTPDADVKAKLMQEEENGNYILKQATQILSNFERSSKSELLKGDAATEIIKFTKEHDIDLIIAGSRGLSQVKGWLLGSVSRKLVHYAPCSVLLVKNIGILK
jgi:nucleotide-binding universal stress UspA family protein